MAIAINALFRKRHIIAGQYLGFTALVLASLPSFFGSLLLPRLCIGLLGLIPIAIGISRLVNANEEDLESEETQTGSAWFSSFIWLEGIPLAQIQQFHSAKLASVIE